MAATFRVLADATRVRLLAVLAEGEQCVQALAQAVTMSASAVSHQLRILREARMVRARRSGRLVYYSLDDNHVHTLFQQALTHVREPRAGGHE
jgi:ArsR family transcriptional regulator, lead/cadmium/zinc/bismuth-responsive transcriptional repressor